MLETFDIARLTEYTFFIIFAVMNLGAVLFSVILMRQISLMNRVFTTQLSPLFLIIAFGSFCVALGILVMSMIYLIP